MESKKLLTYVDCQCVVHLVCMLCLFWLDHHMGRDDLAEAIKKQTGKDFLLDILHLFCMQATQANGIFQLPEGRFNPQTPHCKALRVYLGKEVLVFYPIITK